LFDSKKEYEFKQQNHRDSCWSSKTIENGIVGLKEISFECDLRNIESLYEDRDVECHEGVQVTSSPCHLNDRTSQHAFDLQRHDTSHTQEIVQTSLTFVIELS